MILEYDQNPNLTIDEKLRSLKESVQRALDRLEGSSGGQTVIIRQGGGGGSGTSNYGDLTNKPSINGVTLVGNKTTQDLHISGTDANYVHTQGTASATWTVNHGLGKYPSITVVDSTGKVVVGEYEYIDTDNVKMYFSGAFSGKAYFN